jgi:hypothetical protein
MGVNINGQLVGTGVDLEAGQSDFWWVGPMNYGEMLWASAVPLSGPPWDKDLEVVHLSNDSDATGNRVVHLEVHNKSASDFASYGLFIAWTDAIQT